MTGAIDGVVLLAGELFKHDRWKSCLEHGLQGFLEVWISATGADLTMANSPVPGPLKIPRNTAFTIAAGHKIKGLHQADLDRVFAVGRREAQLKPDGIFLKEPQPESGRELKALNHSDNNACSLVHSVDPYRIREGAGLGTSSLTYSGRVPASSEGGSSSVLKRTVSRSSSVIRPS